MSSVVPQPVPPLAAAVSEAAILPHEGRNHFDPCKNDLRLSQSVFRISDVDGGAVKIKRGWAD